MALEAIPSLLEMMESKLEVRRFIHNLARTQGSEQWTIEKMGETHLKKGPRYSVPWTRQFGEVWSMGLSLAYLSVPRQLRQWVHNEFRWFGIMDITDSNALSEAFKAITVNAKKCRDALYGTSGTDEWKWLVDWQNQGIHGRLDTAEQVTTFNDDVKSFVTSPPMARDSDVPDIVWDEALRVGIDEVFRDWNWSRELTVFSPSEFAKRPSLWATTGSTVGGRGVRVRQGEEEFPTGRTKWSTFLQMNQKDVDDVMNLNSENQFLAKPFPKVETVYREVPRAVINGSFGLYYNMALIYQVVEQVTEGDERGAAWNGDSTRLFQKLASYSEYNSKDIKQYDHNIKKRYVMMFFEELRVFFRHFVMTQYPWLETCFDNVKYLLENTQVSIGDELIKWLNGLLSGWKFTACMGTTINLAIDYAIRAIYCVAVPKVLVTQGDDYEAVDQCTGDSIATWEAMIENGFVIKPGESTIQDQGEFLRYVVGKGRVFGYPIRVVSSNLWREEYLPTTMVEHANEDLTHYVTAVSRGCDEVFWETRTRVMLRGLLGQDAEEWAISPATLGGGGMWEWRREDDKLYEWKWMEEREPNDNLQPVLGDISKSLTTGFSKVTISRLTESLVISDKIRKVRKNFNLAKRSEFNLRLGNVLVGKLYPSSYLVYKSWEPVYRVEYSSLFGFDVILAEWVKNDGYKTNQPLVIDGKSVSFFDILQPTSVNTFVTLCTSGSKKVINSWVLKRLQFSPPRSKYNNAELVSHVFNYIMDKYWVKLLCEQKITVSRCNDAGVAAEYNTYLLLPDMLVVVAWTN